MLDSVHDGAATSAPEQQPLPPLVGRRTLRSDAPERLTGQTRYVGDVDIPGALHARLVRSPHSSARILRIDRSQALAVPGVVAVLTASDLGVPGLEEAVEARRILLALNQVYYAGHPIAVVLGETDAAAEDGAALVEAEYEVLPAVVDAERSRMPDAPVVRVRRKRDHEELGAHGAAPEDVAENGAEDAPNVASRTHLGRGSVEQGFAEADVVVEFAYQTSRVHQGYIEPLVCTATSDPLGRLTVYTSTQALFQIRDEIARTLGISDQDVVVHAMPVGGAFGGKFGLVEPTVAAVARAVGCSVRLVYTRVDEMVAARPAPESRARVKIGARRDGTLTTLQAELLFDPGSDPGAPVGIAAIIFGSLYRWEHVSIDGLEVLTHKSGTGAYRAPGAPQAVFALESTVDEVARQLGIDPFELRLKNAVEEGDVRADGSRWPRIGLRECLRTAEPAYRAERAAAGPGEGVGIALGGWPGGLQPASALCQLNSDGTLQVTVGAVDLSGNNTTFQILAASAFGYEDLRRVKVVLASTDSAPYAGASAGSKITYTVGAAILRAAQDAREQVLRVASGELEAAVEDLEIVDGRVQVRGVPNRAKTLREIYSRTTTYGAKYEPILGRGQIATRRNSPGFAVQIARVRVDPETGRVDPLRQVCVQDVGRAINPAAVEGQMHGGSVQGIGWGLYERIVFDEEGTPLTGSLMDYALPRASQSPDLGAIMVEVPSLDGPYGAKGVGEPSVISVPAAVANAIRDAAGVRLTRLPILSEDVYAALSATAGAVGRG